MVCLALLAIGASYATTASRPGDSTGTTSGASPDLALSGFFDEERGPDGLGWRWMSRSARVRIEGKGNTWLGFRALSFTEARTLTVGSRTSAPSVDAHIAPTPQFIIIGPLTVRGVSTLRLTPSPGARPSPQDARALSIFMSTLRASQRPIIALPGKGFFPTETNGAGEAFNWLRDRGRIDVKTTSPSTKWCLLSFSLTSADARRRVLTLRNGATTKRVAVPPSGTEQRVTVGPFPMNAGFGRIRLSVDLAARRYPPDTRRISVRIGQLQALRSTG